MADNNEIQIEGDDLVELPQGLDRVWSVQNKIVIPLSTIAHVSVKNDPSSIATGLRGPGLDIAGKLAGTFHPRSGERDFWNYSGSGPALAITLDGTQHFARLYLSVVDPGSSATLISDAIASRNDS